MLTVVHDFSFDWRVATFASIEFVDVSCGDETKVSQLRAEPETSEPTDWR